MVISLTLLVAWPILNYYLGNWGDALKGHLSFLVHLFFVIHSVNFHPN